MKFVPVPLAKPETPIFVEAAPPVIAFPMTP